MNHPLWVLVVVLVYVRDVNPRYTIIHRTPWEIHIEPENQLVVKEGSLPKVHVQSSRVWVSIGKASESATCLYLQHQNLSHRVQVPPEDGLGGEKCSREWSNWGQKTSSGCLDPHRVFIDPVLVNVGINI